MSNDGQKSTKRALFDNPFKIYGWSFLLLLICLLIGSIAKAIIRPDFNPNIAIMLIYIFVLFLLSILTSIMYRPWFKKYWFVNLIVFLLTGFPLFVLFVLLGSHNVC
jgi:hypothetical protein